MVFSRMEIPKDPRFKNIAGRKFHRLTVEFYVGPAPGRQKLWMCRCDCGKQSVVRSASILSGGAKSCGCIHREMLLKRNITHGNRHHPLYPTWNNMRHRCLNPKCKEWKNYGARGISICAEWDDFLAFAKDMGPKPDVICSIERRNTNGNYEPGNCFWATPKQQSNNTRRNRLLTYGGRTQNVTQWAEELKVPYEKLRYLVRKNHPNPVGVLVSRSS